MIEEGESMCCAVRCVVESLARPRDEAWGELVEILRVLAELVRLRPLDRLSISAYRLRSSNSQSLVLWLWSGPNLVALDAYCRLCPFQALLQEPGLLLRARQLFI